MALEVISKILFLSPMSFPHVLSGQPAVGLAGQPAVGLAGNPDGAFWTPDGDIRK